MYTLIDGIKINVENPDTLHIPSIEEKHSLEIGDFVKLGFTEEGKPIERMWVKITEISKDKEKCVGILDNDPYLLDAIKYDDVVIFSFSNILAILEG